MTKRNLIMLLLAAVILAGYGVTWCWQTLYRQPRETLAEKMSQLEAGIATGEQNLATMQQIAGANQGYYYRSLPRLPEAARSQYQFWLWELLQFCQMQSPQVEVAAPQRSETGGYLYRTSVRTRGSLDATLQFLYEFSWAPFLHRLTLLTISPREDGEVDLVATIDAIAIPPALAANPYPLTDQLPSGFVTPRLASLPLDAYQVVIERSLLEEVEGGIDAADYAYVTGINREDETWNDAKSEATGRSGEIWMTLRLDDSVRRFRVGDAIQYGSFDGTVVAIFPRDVVFRRGDFDWLVSVGERLADGFAIPPEAAPHWISPREKKTE